MPSSATQLPPLSSAKTLSPGQVISQAFIWLRCLGLGAEVWELGGRGFGTGCRGLGTWGRGLGAGFRHSGAGLGYLGAGVRGLVLGDCFS